MLIGKAFEKGYCLEKFCTTFWKRRRQTSIPESWVGACGLVGNCVYMRKAKPSKSATTQGFLMAKIIGVAIAKWNARF